MFNFDVITKDQDIVKKLVIGGLLSLTGIGLFAVLGWMVEIMREVSRGEEPVMPDFDNIGEFFMDGLKVSLVGIVWSLPVALLVVIFVSLMIFAPAFGFDGDTVAAMALILSFCLVALVFLTLIPITLLLIPALGIYAETGSVKAALNVREAFVLVRANVGGFLIAALLGLLVQAVLNSIGTLLCVIGVFPAGVVSYALQGQLFGNAYMDARANLAGDISPV